MIIKMLGALFIVLSTSLIGIYYANIEVYRLKDLQTLKKAFTILYSEIDFASTSLPIALEQISNKLNNNIGLIFKDLSMEIGKKTGENIYDIWKRIIEENIRITNLNKEDTEDLVSFGKIVGYLDKNMQLKNIQLYIKSLEDEIIKSREDKIIKSKLYKSLGLLSGLLITIVLF